MCKVEDSHGDESLHNSPCTHHKSTNKGVNLAVTRHHTNTTETESPTVILAKMRVA